MWLNDKYKMERKGLITKEHKKRLLSEVKKFINFYKKYWDDSLMPETYTIYLNFGLLKKFSNELASGIMVWPEYTLDMIEQVMESTLNDDAIVRIKNFSKYWERKIKNLRSRDLDELVVINGIVKSASDIRPQVVNAKFKCLNCRAIIKVLQTEKKFKKPSECRCKEKKEFKLVSKDMMDTQRLVIEELPKNLIKGAEPRKINFFIKEDLVDLGMEEITLPGKRVKVIGILREVEVPLETGGISTKLELAIEGNNIFLLGKDENLHKKGAFWR